MKTNEQRAKEYETDKRWKEVKALTEQMLYEKAANLSNEIIDSYPHYIRQMAFPQD